jgi:hypothetical protein
MSQEILDSVKSLGASIDTIKAQAAKAGLDATEAAKVASEMKSKLDGMQFATPEDVKAASDTMQAQLDKFFTEGKKAKPAEKKSLSEGIIQALDGRMDEFETSLKKHGNFNLELKDIALTGDPVASYNSKQYILPGAPLNLRDLIPTLYSPTGLYVSYKETATTNNVAVQTEGASKGANSYALSEVKTVTEYIAGTSTFSKQLSKNLPWLSGTLPRLLERDFFFAENAKGYAVFIAAATGTTTTAETNDIKQLVDYIANQKTARFNASFIAVSNVSMAALLKATIDAGYYAGNGSVVVSPNGGLTIWGVPVIAVDWVLTDKVIVVDNAYFERVEAESMNIQFSYEEGNNFTKNLVTARVECMEAFNLMLPTSGIYADLGNIA